MTIKILLKDAFEIQSLTIAQFSEVMNIQYLPQLGFATAKYKTVLERRCQKAFEKGRFTQRQIFSGHYYSKELQTAIMPDIVIAWIDKTIGYGVWTNQDIPAHTYIGEYTGILRRPRFFKDRDNYYCFNYYITMSCWERNLRVPYLIDAQDAGNFTRYINHSDTPNLGMISTYHGGILHIIFYARSFIPKGTQLVYDYGPIYWEKRAEPFPLSNDFPVP